MSRQPSREHKLADTVEARKKRRLMGRNIRMARNGRQWTLTKLAKEAGIGVSTASGIESGAVGMSQAVYLRMVELFRPGAVVPLMEEFE